MSKELVIGSNRHETKVAVLEDDQLVEVFFQRGNEYSLAGSVHKGRVTRVLPGMQSAFVDLGLERDTFLYVSDFFEENEDVDTVAEEKPQRNERRERNQPRGPERVEAADAVTDPAIASRPILVTPPRELPREIESDPEPVSPISASSAQTLPGEIRAADPNGDRNLRGGDRRGRRSRRRKQRGRGFPDNKYAQPGTAVSGSEPVRPASLHDERGDEEESSVDVIVLPGESLAKYSRSVPMAEPRLSEEQEFRPYTETVSEDLPRAQAAADEDEAQEEEDREIEAEAEEIELADKVFGHHDDESPDEVEEKIAEVKQDVPADSVAEETYPADDPLPFRMSPSEPEPAAFIEEGRTGISPLDAALEASPWAPGVEPLERLVSEEFEVVAIDGEGEDPETGSSTGELSESGTNGAPAVAGESALGGESPESSAQTASVREQGGRYMHRLSRRMRRRRGGNRFGNQQNESAGEPRLAEPKLAATEAKLIETTPAEFTGAAAGAAVAFEPEERVDIVEERATQKPERVYPSISDLLKPGQEIIVQIAKEPLGQKGARITSHIALPGRFVVFMPSVTHLGVSRKVASDEERQRLKRILQAHRPGATGGFIVRTAGEGVPEEEIAADMKFLYTLWTDIRQKAEKKPAPALLHYDLDIVQRILRDQVTDEFKAIWVDNEELYESVVTFMQRFQPNLVNRVKMYTRSAPIFDAFNITQELEKALRPKVWLKSGGYIVINQTEALVAIDINTGKYVGKSNRLEDTIVKTNTEAVKEIVRQIRLRDLGGIIVVDFIDMDERKNRQKVMQALEEAMRADKAPYKILQFNDFGLVAITRKRVKQSLERTLCMPCPYCEGAGYVKSVSTVISEILVEAQKIARAIEGKDVVLRVHPDVAKVLKSSNNQYLEELEEVLGRPVLVAGDATLHHQKFDLG